MHSSNAWTHGSVIIDSATKRPATRESFMKLAQRVFSYADQIQFAAASGDYNPMHVDPLQARRTQAGAPVVHGIHLLIWALDSLASEYPDLPPLRSLRAQFRSFVFLDEVVAVELAQKSATAARLVIAVDGATRSKVTIDIGQPAEKRPEWAARPLKPVPRSSEPLNLTLDEISGRSGCIPLQMTTDEAAASFPNAAKWLGGHQIAALAATTHLVGMICPGLHSIYSELEAAVCDGPGDENSLKFRVTDTDARFRSVELEIASAALSGVVRSFARNPPVEQPAMQSLARRVGPAEFSGATALVIGGSRGLGELAAKIIAAGGGRVVVTWQAGKVDAQRVAQEIRAAGGDCQALAYDARVPASEQLQHLESEVTHAYYFATPAIFRPQSDIFNPERLKEFLSVYVDGFWNLCQALRRRQPRLSLFYPSSVAVTERPKGMTEYTMAKAAGEILCTDMNSCLGPSHVTVSRLPRLPTDQTASITPAESADPLETMLPIIREVQSWPR